MKREKPKHLAYASIEREVGNFLYWLARMTCAKRILETGSNQGYSSSMLACAVRDNSDGELILIDVNANDFLYKATELEHFVTFLHGSSLDVHVTGEFDMMFLDSDHSYNTIMREVIRFDPLLKINGVMCFHDSKYFDGIGLCVKQLMETGRYEVVNLDGPRMGQSIPRRTGVTIVRKVLNMDTPDLVYDENFANVGINLTAERASSAVPFINLMHPFLSATKHPISAAD